MCAFDFCVCVCVCVCVYVYFLLLLITHVCIAGLEFESDDEIGRLSISIDFLVGLSDNVSAKGEVDASFSTFSHQAIDFILGSGLDNDMDPQFCAQHIIRKLGKEEFIGQRTMLILSQKITIVVENLLLLDPFHDNYPNLHAFMFLLIQLIEFMISDYIRTWFNSEQFDKI
ncbi:protein MULTIPOLAR SPINDLE 1-like [Carex rostrata]